MERASGLHCTQSVFRADKVSFQIEQRAQEVDGKAGSSRVKKHLDMNDFRCHYESIRMHNQSIMSTFPGFPIRLKYLAVARVSQYYNIGETRGHGAGFYVNVKSVLKAFWSKDISDRTKSSRSIPWPNVERSNCCWS